MLLSLDAKMHDGISETIDDMNESLFYQNMTVGYKILMRKSEAHHDDGGENSKHQQRSLIAHSFHEDLLNGGMVQLEPNTNIAPPQQNCCRCKSQKQYLNHFSNQHLIAHTAFQISSGISIMVWNQDNKYEGHSKTCL